MQERGSVCTAGCLQSVLAWQPLNKDERREIKKTEEEGGGRV